MKHLILFVFHLSLLVATTQAGDNISKEIIFSDSLNRIEVVGKLNLPLGTPAEVHATIIAHHSKLYNNSYRLQINTVNGKALKSKPVLTFRFAPGRSPSSRLANSAFSLYKAKHGKPAGTLTSEKIDELNDGYVGTPIVLKVYESGEFSGIPPLSYREDALWSDHSFGFSTYLMILREIER